MKCVVRGLVVLSALLCALSTAADEGEEPAVADFAAALKGAQEDPSVPIGLEVNCAGEQGLRQFRVYPDGVAFWNNEVQVPVTAETRHGLLQDLLEADYASFESHYGGGDGEEEFDGPVRVTCQIDIRVSGHRKQAVQERDGEQFAPLRILADALLDRGEALAPSGIRVTGLEDGLAKLGAGELAREALGLRFLYLPSDESAIGLLLQIEDGRLVSRRYRPGVELQSAAPQALTAETLAKVVDALKLAKFWNLPVNVQADDHYQVYLNVLRFRSTVVARPFGRKATDAQRAAEDVVARLVSTLREIGEQANAGQNP